MFENKRHDWIITFAKSGGIGLDELGAKKQESVVNKEGSEKKGRKRLLFVDLSSTN